MTEITNIVHTGATNRLLDIVESPPTPLLIENSGIHDESEYNRRVSTVLPRMVPTRYDIYKWHYLDTRGYWSKHLDDDKLAAIDKAVKDHMWFREIGYPYDSPKENRMGAEEVFKPSHMLVFKSRSEEFRNSYFHNLFNLFY